MKSGRGEWCESRIRGEKKKTKIYIEKRNHEEMEEQRRGKQDDLRKGGWGVEKKNNEEVQDAKLDEIDIKIDKIWCEEVRYA